MSENTANTDLFFYFRPHFPSAGLHHRKRKVDCKQYTTGNRINTLAEERYISGEFDGESFLLSFKFYSGNHRLLIRPQLRKKCPLLEGLCRVLSCFLSFTSCIHCMVFSASISKLDRTTFLILTE